MSIPSPKYLWNKAGLRLASGKEPKATSLWFAGITSVVCLLVSTIQYILQEQISRTGGLSNMGLRSILSTMSNVLPILQTVFLTALTLGYTAAMLRIARSQFASPRTLKAGFERFWPLLKTRLLLGLLCFALAIPAVFLTAQIFSFTHWSAQLMEAAAPYLSDLQSSPEAILEYESITAAAADCLIPMTVIYLLIYLPALLFVTYRYRMADYILIDKPGIGAAAAMKQSRLLMSGNCLKLFRVDLSFWWFYLLDAAAYLLLYLDVVLALLGIPFPLSDTAGFFVLIIAYQLADFGITVLIRPRIEVAYALSYHSIAPKEAQPQGAVLGSIFDSN